MYIGKGTFPKDELQFWGNEVLIVCSPQVQDLYKYLPIRK